MKQHTYIAIDLKSFYASVECRDRGLDPLDTNLVVADESRTDKTICLAVTPTLKSFGIPGRARLFEVKQRVQEVNADRKRNRRGREFAGSSHFYSELSKDPSLALDFIIASPRMAYYMEYSTRIYEIYMKYVAPEDIIGVPQIVDGRSVFCPPRMIAREEPYCLFLDELNACSQEVQKAFYSLILERHIGEYHLPKGSILVVGCWLSGSGQSVWSFKSWTS